MLRAFLPFIFIPKNFICRKTGPIVLIFMYLCTDKARMRIYN